MARTCNQHPGVPATAVCHQCRKPVCSDCTIVGTGGMFCSQECALEHSILTTGPSAQADAGIPGRLGVIGCAAASVLMLLAVMIIVHFAARAFPALESMDLIGRLLDGLRRIFLQR